MNGNFWKILGTIGAISVIFSAGIFTGTVLSHMGNSDIHHSTEEKNDLIDERIKLQIDSLETTAYYHNESIKEIKAALLRIEEKL